MNGYELMAEIKKDPTQPVAQIPVLVISAVAATAKEKLPQVQGIFSKPVNFSNLLNAIHGFCA